MLVAVTSAHRGDAFAACEFIMDYLKTRAPFWKKEDARRRALGGGARRDEAAAARWSGPGDGGDQPDAVLIGIDWGTSPARAYRIGGGGVSSPRGRRSASSAWATAVRRGCDELLGDWRAIRCRGSPRHGRQPQRLDRSALCRLACNAGGARRRHRRTPGGELAIVPGVMAATSHGTPDVMRGEETQLVGAQADAAGATLFVMPGTHGNGSTRARRHRRFRDVHDRRDLRGDARAFDPWPPRGADRRAARAGVRARRRARSRRGRTVARPLRRAYTRARRRDRPDDVADYLSGLLIGRESRRAALGRCARRTPCRVALVGADALADRYATALAHAGVESRRTHGAAARGLWRIARAASEFPGLSLTRAR